MPAFDCLTRPDLQEVRDFERFLQVVGPISTVKERRPLVNHPRGYAWAWYVKGEAGAPPEMWEGDDN